MKILKRQMKHKIQNMYFGSLKKGYLQDCKESFSLFVMSQFEISRFVEVACFILNRQSLDVFEIKKMRPTFLVEFFLSSTSCKNLAKSFPAAFFSVYMLELVKIVCEASPESIF